MRLFIPVTLSIALLLQQVLAVPIASDETSIALSSKEQNKGAYYNSPSVDYHYASSSSSSLLSGHFESFTWHEAHQDFAEECFEFDLATTMILQVTDVKFSGDMFEIFDNGASLGKTSVPSDMKNQVHVNDPENCLSDDRFSRGQIVLHPGHHRITIKIIKKTYAEGRGALRLVYASGHKSDGGDKYHHGGYHHDGDWDDNDDDGDDEYE
ncbi:hypothetical protein BJ944DRAFT_266284 [Cunninghamella echinulata]|nr:hypothetical protein BJ944DRAFT_266284 [Cunninghamella echinulata]